MHIDTLARIQPILSVYDKVMILDVYVAFRQCRTRNVECR